VTRFRPPRPDGSQEPAEADLGPADDSGELLATAERLLASRTQVSVADLLEEADDWPTCRRVLAQMTAIHHHPELAFELIWDDGLRIDPRSCPSWVSEGWFRRVTPAGAGAR
jgi:hypothetical protein